MLILCMLSRIAGTVMWSQRICVAPDAFVRGLCAMRAMGLLGMERRLGQSIPSGLVALRLGADECVRPYTDLVSGRALGNVTAVERQTDATLVVELRGRRPIDIVGADYAGATAHQRVRDPAIGIAISAHFQHCAIIQNKHRHAGRALNIAGDLARDKGRVTGLRHGRVAHRTHRQLWTIARLRIVEALIAEAIEEMPARAIGLRYLRDLHIVHEPKTEHGLALQCRTRSARRQRHDLPRPERRQHPFHNVALRVTLAVDRKSTRLNSSHVEISYAVFCLKKKKKKDERLFLNKKKKKKRNST